jgi:hypothetical protein
MSTLHVAAAKPWCLPDLSRLSAFFAALIDVFAEAKTQARAAHERYPFVE